MNKLWIYGGPREGNKNVPQDGQHWPYNITKDDPGLAAFPTFSAVSALIDSSRADYFVRILIRIFDSHESEALRPLYRRWWIAESGLRAKPQTLVHITPDPGIKPTFRTGDKIHTAATTKLRGGWSGTQRVMEYSYRWDSNGVVRIAEPITQPGVVAPAIAVTSDAEGI
jgi:hypothetical protein